MTERVSKTKKSKQKQQRCCLSPGRQTGTQMGMNDGTEKSKRKVKKTTFITCFFRNPGLVLGWVTASEFPVSWVPLFFWWAIPESFWTPMLRATCWIRLNTSCNIMQHVACNMLDDVACNMLHRLNRALCSVFTFYASFIRKCKAMNAIFQQCCFEFAVESTFWLWYFQHFYSPPPP